jgi:hypothetical protein
LKTSRPTTNPITKAANAAITTSTIKPLRNDMATTDGRQQTAVIFDPVQHLVIKPGSLPLP